MPDHKSYWNTQFSKYAHVWGETPSKSAGIALSLFRDHQVNKILVPGSGYDGSFLEDDFAPGPYQGIYCFNVLQLFLKPDRICFVRKSAQRLASKGLMFFTGVSDGDGSYGKGEEVEPDTFAVQPDKTLHFFTADDLKSHFEEFQVLQVGELEDQVSHSLHGPKRYQIRYILVAAR